MLFAKLIKNMFIKKTALALMGLSLSMGIFGNVKNYTKDEQNQIASSSQSKNLPEGSNDKERFLSSLKDTNGIEGQLDLTLNLKDKGASYSIVKVKNASLHLAKPSSKKGALDLNMTVDYNGVAKSAHVNYSNETAYINIEGLKYRYSESTYKSVVSKIISIFGADSLKVPDSVYDFAESFMGKDDFSTSFELQEESSDYGFAYKVNLGNDNFIHLEEDDEYNLSKVYSDKLTIGDSYMSFEFSTTTNDNELTVIENLKPTDSSTYKEVYNSMDLIRKIHNLTSSMSFGVSLEGTLHHEIAATNKHEAAEENITLNANIFADINASEYNGIISAYPNDSAAAPNSISFSSLKEINQNTYLNYNDVMKVSLANPVLDELIARIKADFGDEFNLLDKLLNLLDESFVSNIKNGRYQDLLSSLKSLSNNDNVITLSLNLGVFGFSEESEMVIEINANDNKDLAKITLNNVGLNGFYLNDTTIKLVSYQKPSMNTEGFYALNKLPDIYSQIYDIYSSPKLHLSIEGSYVDSNGVGLSTIKGEANLTGHTDEETLYEFDGGYVDILLGQQVGIDDDNGNFSKLGNYKKHHVSLDLEKLETAYFHYYDEDSYANDSSQAGTYGKLSIQPFEDVVTIIDKIYNSDDPRFNKFFTIVEGVAASNVIDALKTGQYSPLLATNLLVSSSFTADYSEITLSGKAFGFNDENNDNNFTVSLQYEGNNVKTLKISNLVFGGNTLNLAVTLSDYIEGKTSVVDHSLTTMDFTSMSALISDLYNTANLKTYHLTSSNIGVYLKLIGIIDIDIKLEIDVRLFVDGTIVKAYGMINVPVSLLYSDTYKSGLTFYSYRNCVLYYDNIDPDTNEAYKDNSGYVYLTYNLSKKKTEYSGSKVSGSFKYHTDYLSDTQHLLKFLFRDMMDIKSSYYSSIESAITKKDTSGKAMDLERLVSSYSYDESTRKWDMALAIDALMRGDDTLQNFTISLQSAYSNVAGGYVLSQGDVSVNLNVTALSGSKISGTIKNEDLDVEDNWSSVSETYQNYINSHRTDAVSAS